MDYAAVLAALDNASGFELYRLRAAIERVLDEPRWILAIGARLRIGQRVEFFDVRANGAQHVRMVSIPALFARLRLTHGQPGRALTSEETHHEDHPADRPMPVV